MNVTDMPDSVTARRVGDGGNVLGKLASAGLLTADQTERAAGELATRLAAGAASPVSALHVVRDLGLTDIDAALAFLHRDSGMPILPAAQFAPQGRNDIPLHVPFMVHHSVIPLDTIDDHLMVGVLDPYDPELQSLVTAMAGMACLFYLVDPTSFDTVLALIRGAK
jgi:hypothetical protein